MSSSELRRATGYIEAPAPARNREGLPQRPLEKHGVAGLAALGRAAGVAEADNLLIPIFRTMVAPWGQLPIGDRPRFHSDASNDGTPFEYSVAFGEDRPELRFMVEAQGEGYDLRANQLAGRELTERLHRELDVPIARVRRVEDLFFPPEPQGLFAVWHAVAWRNGTPPAFKLYLGLGARGRKHAHEVLEQAMTRLGFEESWREIYRGEASRGALDERLYFSLDLSRSTTARMKVYTRHHRTTIADIEAACAATPSYRVGDAAALLRAMGHGDGPYLGRPVITCLSFVEGQTLPTASTIHFPICAYAENDADAYDRIHAFLERNELPTAPYEAVIREVATRPLAAGNGLQSYASFRRDPDMRLTVYLGPEAYATVVPREPRLAIAP